MGNLLLSSDSVMMCPHGGMVTWVPTGATTYRISGRPPMQLGDVFTISGCPYYIGSPSPCIMAQWYTASTMLIVMGRPVLTNASVGMCVGANGAPQGPVIIAAHQLGVREPDEFTAVNE